MIVLSLFDGLSGARIALNNVGVKCIYYASEIDKGATSISKYHFSDVIQLGDVTKLTKDKINGSVDLLIGGSPCTSLSAIAGQKESGLEKGESMLFWEYLRVLKEFKPKYFLLENVASMKPRDKERITKEVKDIYMDSYCIKIDSSLLTAQSRKRLYWTNIPKVTLPEDRGLVLGDILDAIVIDEKSYYKEDGFKIPMNGSYGGENGSFKEVMTKKGITTIYTYDYESGDEDFDSDKYPKESESRPNKGYKIDVTETKNRTRANRYRLEHIRGTKQKSRCLGTGCLSIANTSGTGVFKDGVYRSLTLGELERLQGLPTDFTKYSKNSLGVVYNTPTTHRAKAIGNGFTIPVIEHILGFIPEIQNGEWK